MKANMHHKLLTGFLAAALAIAASTTTAEEDILPPLPTKGFTYGRIATQADVASGDAAFATPPEQDAQRKPMDFPIPSYAVYLADGKNELVFVIQAELVNGEPMIGARLTDGGEIVGNARDFRFRGVKPTLANESSSAQLATGKGAPHAADSTIASVTQQPSPISIPAAPYPPWLLRACKGGRVEFVVTIAEDGRISEVEILGSPDRELSRAVVRTIREQWQFRPYDAGTPMRLATFRSYMNFDPECHPRSF